MSRKWEICIVTTAALTVFFSCSKVKPSYNRENMKGTWIADVYDGVTADPSKWTVQSYADKNSMTLYGVCDLGDGNRTWDKCQMSYEAYCCDITCSGQIKGFFGIPVTASLTRNYSFASTQDSLVTLEMISEKINGEPVFSDHNRLTMRKIVKSYSAVDSLVGIWQTYSFDDQKFESWRMIFGSDNSFIFSVQTPSGAWMAIGDGTDGYSVYSDFIALTVKDNPYLGTAGYTDVAFFTSLVARPKSSFMSFNFGGHTITLTYVSSLD